MTEKFELKRFQDGARRTKDAVFNPLTKVFYALGFRPLTFSILALFFGTLAAISVLNSKKLALIFLLLNLFCDNMDGALARYRRNPTNAGWWQDYMVDRTVRVEFFIVVIMLSNKAAAIVCAVAMTKYIVLNTVMAVTKRRYHMNLDYIFYLLLFVHPEWSIIFALLESGPGLLVLLYERIAESYKKTGSNTS